jgi:hypothetical protein
MNVIAGGDWKMAEKALKKGLEAGINGAILGSIVEPGPGTLFGFSAGLFCGIVASFAEDIIAGAHP